MTNGAACGRPVRCSVERDLLTLRDIRDQDALAGA